MTNKIDIRPTFLNADDRIKVMCLIHDALMMCIKMSIRLEKSNQMSKVEIENITENFSVIMTMVSKTIGLNEEETNQYMKQSLSDIGMNPDAVLDGVLHSNRPN